MLRRILLVLCLLVVGCEANHYEIELQPRDGGINRKVIVWRESSSQNNRIVQFPQEELTKIADVYGQEPPSLQPRKYTFASMVREEMPQDLGGSGWYASWDSPWGRTSAYVERVRGNDDLLADVETRLRAADHLVEHLITFVKEQLEGEPHLSQIVTILDGEVRHDCKNASLYLWSIELPSSLARTGYATTSNDAIESLIEPLVRLGQYLVERDYLEPNEFPQVVRQLSTDESEGIGPLLSILERKLSAELGLPAWPVVPRSQKFFSDEEATRRALESYLRGTEEYAQLVQRENARRGSIVGTGSDEPDPLKALSSLSSRAFLPRRFLIQNDHLNVSLETPVAPFATNGRWNANEKVIQWRGLIEPRKLADSQMMLEGMYPQYPQLLYAFWSEPDNAAQSAHLDRVLLKDESLAHYCLWYAGLNEAETKNWDEFVTQLMPGSQLVENIEEFRLSPGSDTVGNDKNRDLADLPRMLLLKELGRGRDTE